MCSAVTGTECAEAAALLTEQIGGDTAELSQALSTDLFEPLLPHTSALTLHHVQPRQDDQVRLKLLQACHERLQQAHLPIGHVMGEDEAVGLRCLS